MRPRIHVLSVFVDDQAKALAFYTERLGFLVKNDVPVGEFRWLTVVGPDQPDGVELLLEPNDNPAAREFQRALVEQGIPAASFRVDDVEAACRELAAQGVRITQEPAGYDDLVTAVIDDTCGNLIQLLGSAS
jgi:catechol 2,3-dioxygenase-like lactoylglutathione lyase family enzyme